MLFNYGDHKSVCEWQKGNFTYVHSSIHLEQGLWGFKDAKPILELETRAMKLFNKCYNCKYVILCYQIIMLRSFKIICIPRR